MYGFLTPPRETETVVQRDNWRLENMILAVCGMVKAKERRNSTGPVAAARLGSGTTLEKHALLVPTNKTEL